MTHKVLCLGSRGMLGSMVHRVLSASPDFEVTVADRHELDAKTASVTDIGRVLSGVEPDWIINCVGIIKPKIDRTDEAISVNALFPHKLNTVASALNIKVIQIATDCVYSGQYGCYTEDSAHDALDIYGKTKSLGEVTEDNFINLRCSIIGPEQSSHLSLMDWLLGQPMGAVVSGYTNHVWNGLTTLHFARICEGIIRHNLAVRNMQHIIPANVISKADLLRCISKAFNREDIIVQDTEAPTVIDRTLNTDNWTANDALWLQAGYKEAPTIEEMVDELGAYERRD